MMKHTFDCLARLCKEPDGLDGKSTGATFRRDNGDMVQLALQVFFFWQGLELWTGHAHLFHSSSFLR